VLLAYRLPREPSTPRIAVWCKLRRLGALPLDARNREQLEWLAGEIAEAQGEATLWVGAPTSRGQERRLAARMAAAIGAEYAALVAEAEQALEQAPGSRRRSLARLRRELRRIRARDYFPPPERERAQRAVDALAQVVEEVAR
jgi:hypothetical protein